MNRIAHTDEKYIHISEKFRRDSILTNGLLPSKILNSEHLSSFRNYGYVKKNEDKMLYLWESSDKDNKYIEDLIYCKLWLHPRIKYINGELEKGKEWPDFSKLPHDLLYWAPYTNMEFDVYEVTKPKLVNNYNSIVHFQNSSDDRKNSAYEMDDKYSHDDKILGFSTAPAKDIKIIKTVSMDINLKGKLTVRIK